METVRYNYRLRPGAEALAYLLAEWGRCRWLWNECVHQFRSRRKPTVCRLSKLLTAERARSGWLRAGSQNTQQQMLRTYLKALGDSYTVEGRHRPRVKKRKKTLPSFEYTVNGFAIKDGRCARRRV